MWWKAFKRKWFFILQGKFTKEEGIGVFLILAKKKGIQIFLMQRGRLVWGWGGGHLFSSLLTQNLKKRDNLEAKLTRFSFTQNLFIIVFWNLPDASR